MEGARGDQAGRRSAPAIGALAALGTLEMDGHSGHHAHPPASRPSPEGRGHGAHREHAEPTHAGHGAMVHEAGHPGADHDKHAGHSVAMFRDKFWISLLLMIPTLVWGHMLPGAFGYSPPHFTGSHWIPVAFGSAVFVYGGWPFLQGAVGELKARLPGMMTLIALAISVSFVFSLSVTAGFPAMPLWEELATLVVIMLLGHWIEMRSITQAQGALKELARLLPDRATRVDGDRLA